MLGPTYAEHAHARTRVDVRVNQLTDFGTLGTAYGAVVCNPNNPDSRRIRRRQLLALADRLASKPAGRLSVDEAFADL